ncbi:MULTISPECIES: oligoribonuclease [unclassified Agarivorans]|uniref:oligoribonuclease n=1 Tax=unclassified Agarivorans TaxID=2636026 RepID=UPI003D7C6E04
MTVSEQNLIWVDMEMTGLEPMNDRVLEIASIVTDAQLNILAEGPVIAVYQSDAVLAGMDEWCTNTHNGSGLVKRVRASTIDEQQAALQTIDFIKQWVPQGVSPMCGNSIGQDRRFMHHYLPELEKFFHYRNIDVSTVKELARRWRPEILDGFSKSGTHLALDDIRESIAEMRHYQKTFFKLGEN